MTVVATALEPGDPDAARAARDALRAARKRRRGERLVDAYVVAFAVLMFTVWGLSFARQSFAGTACGDACALQEAPALTAAAWALTLGGLLVLALGAVGPVSVGRPEARWLLGATADRSILLRGPLAASVAGASVAGTAAGLVVALAAGGGTLTAARLVAGGAVGAVLGVVATLALLPRQARPGSEPPGRLAGGIAVIAGLALLLVAATLGDRVGDAGNEALAVAPAAAGVAVVLVLGVAVAVVLGVRAPRHLTALTDTRLAAAREVVDAAAGSAAMLDTRAAEGLLRRRSEQRRGRYRSRRGRGRGALAFLDADLATAGRRWRGLLLHLVWVPLVLAAAEGLGTAVAVVLTGLAAAWVARSAGAGLRTWLGSPGLRRSVTAPHLAVVAALVVVPALASTVLTLPTLLLLGAPGWAAAHLGLAAVASTMRSHDPVSHELGPVVATPMGALPVGLMRAVVHGPDLALSLAVLLVVRAEPWVMLAAVAAVTWQVARDRG